MKKLFFIAILIVLIVPHSILAETLSMCFHEGEPTAASTLEDNGIIGDITRNIAERAGYTVVQEFLPWVRCKKEVKDKNIDLVFHMWRDVEDHKKNYDFLKSHNKDVTAFIVKDDSPIQSGKLEDLNGVTLALHRDGGYRDEIKNHPGFKFRYVVGDEPKTKMLRAGRVDMIISDPVRIQYYIDKMGGDKWLKIRILKPYVAVQISSPAIAKDHPKKEEIIKRYNSAFDELCKEGIFTKMEQKHKLKLDSIDCPNRD